MDSLAGKISIQGTFRTLGIRKLLVVLALIPAAVTLVTPAFAGLKPPTQIENTLRARGLIAPAPSQKTVATITPPDNTEVDQRIQTNSKTGLELARIESWNETVDNNVIHIELTTLPSNQREVAFWVFPKDSSGCAMFGGTMYDAKGQALKSSFWRNDPAMRIAGAVNFPPNIYPAAVPPAAFVRVLGTLESGAKGELNQQISPYSYVGQYVRVSDLEQITVPAGSYSAFKVTTSPDVSKLMPSWPGFLLHVIDRFVPTSTYYFDSRPPYRLLKQQGTVAAGGPEVTTELLRFYIAGAQAQNTVGTSVGAITH